MFCVYLYMSKKEKNKKHQNIVYTYDNLYIMNGMADKSVDLIYLDPPFNSEKRYHAPAGTTVKGASFDDIWEWNDVDQQCVIGLINDYSVTLEFILNISEMHSNHMKSYITYMTQRIIHMKRLLKDNGSIYLHCDKHASHYLKIIMDIIFGSNNFLGEICWKRTSSKQKGSQYKAKTWPPNIDSIFCYSKSSKHILYPFGLLSKEEKEKKFSKYNVEKNDYYNTATPIFRDKSLGERPNLCYKWYKEGYVFENPNPSGWRLSKDRLEEEYDKGNIVIKEVVGRDGRSQKKIERRAYYKDYKGKPVGNLWDDILPVKSKYLKKYPTQKPVELLDRIIKASTSYGDIVLDPFCGCATTMVSAYRLGRNFIGIDVSENAVSLLQERLRTEQGLFKNFIATSICPDERDNVERVSFKHKGVKKRLFADCEGYCYCNTQYQLKDFEIDHIIPKSKGGGDYYENYQLLCSNCNKIKGSNTQSYLNDALQKMEQGKKSITYDLKKRTRFIEHNKCIVK